MTPPDEPQVSWQERGVVHQARWWSEASDPAPTLVEPVDDQLSADVALAKLRRGVHLLHRGDFHNARELLAAVGRRLRKRAPPRAKTPKEIFFAERDARAREHELLGRIVVLVDAEARLELRRAPDVREAIAHALPVSNGEPRLLSLRALLGVQGAEQWRLRGVEVPGLKGRIHPVYGVFSPTRREYPSLLFEAPAPGGLRVFDVGCGTGVLGLILLQRGAAAVVGTDLDPRAVACAEDNAARLGYAGRYRALVRDLFPDGRADRVVFNPPWIPAAPKTPIDRAIFDPDNATLRRFLAELPSHLEPDGEGWLLISDLPVHLGLWSPSFLSDLLTSSGLRVAWRREAKPTHGRAADPSDPLHSARAKEIVSLLALRPAS